MGDEKDDNFAKRHKDVFGFEEVKIKHQSENSGQDDEASSSVNEISEKYVSRSGGNPGSFKGRESLYRVPDNEWDKPKRSHRDDDKTFKKPDKFAAFRNRKTGGGFQGSNSSKRPHWNSRKVPDFKKNPSKYVKYSLEDTDVTSNRANSQAAFSFLRELDERKRKTEDNEEDMKNMEKGKIVFKRPNAKSKSGEKDEGGSSSKAKKKKSSVSMLSHLMEEEEEDDD